MKIFGERKRENPIEEKLDGLLSFTYPDGTIITRGMKVTLAGGVLADVRIVTSINNAGEFMLITPGGKNNDQVVAAYGPCRLGDVNLPGTGRRGVETGRWGEVEIYIGMPVKIKRDNGTFEAGWVVTGDDAGALGFVVISRPDINMKLKVSTTDLKEWQVEAK